MKKGRQPMSIHDRFWSKVKKGPKCWEWQGYRLYNGYGRFWMSHLKWPDVEYAHRVAYWLEHGDLPKRGVVRHTCDNPACVNPAHLRLGSQADNIADCISRGRHVGTKGQRFHHLPEMVVRVMRRLHPALNYTEIASIWGVGRQTVMRIVKRQAWRNV